MNRDDAIRLINDSAMNKSQKSAARSLIHAVSRNATSTLDNDVVDYDLRLTGKAGDRFWSFVCFADSKLYAATLTVVIGPRGGKNVGTAELRYQMGGKANFYL